MRIFFPTESDPKETRSALTTATFNRFKTLGIEVIAAQGIKGYLPAEVARHSSEDFPACDFIVTVGRPSDAVLAKAPKGSTWLALQNPFIEGDAAKAGERFAKLGLGALSLEYLPRTTLAQKMDALSSQANLAGYAAVLKAAELSGKVFPMMMTPAGTLQPARVFVIGVGVAGLQAIATAKRLGARIEAFDTRPVVEEQVKSLGAKFVKIDIGQTGQSAQGYATALTPEQLQKQKDGMAKVVAQSDIVITTAKLFGKKPPLLVPANVLDMMKPGSVVIDMACMQDNVGNVEGSRFDEVATTANGVKVYGGGALERLLPSDASEMYAANIANFFEHFFDATAKTVKVDPANELLKPMILAVPNTVTA